MTFTLHKVTAQVFILLFWPRGQPLGQLIALVCVEGILLGIIHGHACAKRPIFVNKGEELVVASTCYVQLVFYMVPLLINTSSGGKKATVMNPGSIMVYV